ncbi:MAG TPA: hypothetical protein VFK38_02080 [Candidatus Limnocylindrales bacterium]|nr:hypothetical protein [Candidatus Limnocylindrales bacterium]
MSTATGTGLSANPGEYRQRLEEQPDEQIDAWAAELMRDMSIRRGVLTVLAEFMAAAGLDERSLERVYAAGGGAPATLGRTAEGRLMAPAISLHHFVSGLRREVPDARVRLIRYLVGSFHEIVYI